EHGDALGNTDDQRDFGINGFADRIRRAGRRHVDHAGVAPGFFSRFGNRVEHRQVEVRGATLSGRGAADHLGAIGDRLFGMERAVLAGKALADHFGVLVDQDGHYAASLTALTIFWAASSRSSAEVTLRLDLAMISLPSATLVPSRRTTSGTRKPTSFTAATTPSAMTSQRMIPPKILIKIPFTLGSEVMILNAAVTFSLLAPPPTSRKFAGVSP